MNAIGWKHTVMIQNAIRFIIVGRKYARHSRNLDVWACVIFGEIYCLCGRPDIHSQTKTKSKKKHQPTTHTLLVFDVKYENWMSVSRYLSANCDWNHSSFRIGGIFGLMVASVWHIPWNGYSNGAHSSNILISLIYGMAINIYSFLFFVHCTYENGCV